MSIKARKIINYETASADLKQLIAQRYPNGFTQDITRVETSTKQTLYVLNLETDDAIYMVKVTPKASPARKTDDDDDMEMDDNSMSFSGDFGDTDSDDDENSEDSVTYHSTKKNNVEDGDEDNYTLVMDY